MFSNRIAADLALNRLAEATRQRRAEGRPILDLTESNPTRAGFVYPDGLLEPLGHPRGLVYQPSPLGIEQARRAVAADYARRGVTVAADRIALAASTSEAYSVIFKLMASPGDEILIPRPSYPLFEHLTALDGVVATPYDLEYHGAWSIDMASVERALGPRTRALLVVHPNNPTGSYVSGSERDRLQALCARRSIAFVADEVFADYALTPGDRRGTSMLGHPEALVFALGGLSKSVGLPQAKLAWMAVSGPEAIVSEALQRLEVVCDAYLSVSTPVQLAASELLDRGAEVRAQISARVRANYRALHAMASSAPSCRVLHADAGWYGVVQVPAIRSEEDLAMDLLLADGVLTHPGYFFDFSRESHLIVSLLPDEAAFGAGIERLFARAERQVGATAAIPPDPPRHFDCTRDRR